MANEAWKEAYTNVDANLLPERRLLGTPSKKENYLDRDIVPISSDPPTYETDRDNW